MFWSETIDVSTFTSLWMETSVASRFASNISGINSIGIFDKGKKKKKKGRLVRVNWNWRVSFDSLKMHK